MVNGADHMPIPGAGRPRSCPLSPNPSPPKPLTPARLESNLLSVQGLATRTGSADRRDAPGEVQHHSVDAPPDGAFMADLRSCHARHPRTPRRPGHRTATGPELVGGYPKRRLRHRSVAPTPGPELPGGSASGKLADRKPDGVLRRPRHRNGCIGGGRKRHGLGQFTRALRAADSNAPGALLRGHA